MAMTNDIEDFWAEIDADEVLSPADAILSSCRRDKALLAEAIENDDIALVVALWTQAEATRSHLASLHMGADVELATTEVLRRSERGLGVVLTRGKAQGLVRTSRDRPSRQVAPIAKFSPKAVFGNRTNLRHDAYLMAAISDADFEVLISACAAEGNLTRAFLLRQTRVENEEPESPRHELLRRTRHIDPNRVVNTTVEDLEGLAIGLGLVWDQMGELDVDQIATWADSLTRSMQSLGRLAKHLNKKAKEIAQ